VTSGRQVTFLPVETLLCLAASFVVNWHHFGGSNAHQAPEPVAALGRLPAAEGISAMNAVNQAAPAPLFMLALFGTGAVAVAASVAALRHLDQRWAVYVLAGTALYLVCLTLTAAYHVPRNNALALVDPTAPGAAQTWAQYLSSWTAWNHVRTVTAVAGRPRAAPAR